MCVVEIPQRYSCPRKSDYTIGSPPETFVIPLLRDRIERVIGKHLAALPRPCRTLDVGCGRQPFRSLLETPESTYLGMDVQQSPEGTVDIVAAIDEALPAELLPCAPFDFLLCSEVLEHVAHWETAFANFATLVRPGGKLLITCPFFFKLHEEPYDFWRPTFHALEHYASRYGFKVVEREAAGDGWDVLGTLLASSSADPRGRLLIHRLMSKAMNGVRRLLFWMLKRGWLQSVAHLHTSIYLCNIILLERT